VLFIIEKIRNDIKNNVGNYVNVVHNDGRNKIYEYKGKLVEIYNNIFIIMLEDGSKRCFKYSDILTKTIELDMSV